MCVSDEEGGGDCGSSVSDADIDEDLQLLYQLVACLWIAIECFVGVPSMDLSKILYDDRSAHL